ncbi:dihydrodipicolinate synthase family protein [Candidatus Pelagibacter sp.]|nr:dihydrodipicolinate synthase family protein [Candidatus Pelagibacter sp.]
MSKFNGIYAAGLSILDENLTLNVSKTIKHAENLIENGCHGVAIFGSTGQAQLLSISEKISLLNELSKSKYKNNFIIGTGLNSLNETINFISISKSLGFKNFLIMPPAYYKYGDDEVFNFYSHIINTHQNIQIILYNFEKLCGYKFSIDCVIKLVEKYPSQIVGIKDSSYNLFEILKIDNFSVLPGSESKLLKGLELGCSGIITATCNVTSKLARKVYDDFHNKEDQTENEKLCKVRAVFDKFNLVSALHTLMGTKNRDYNNILPPISILDEEKKEKLIVELNSLNFKI